MKFKISRFICLSLSIFMLLSVLPANAMSLNNNIHTTQKLTVQKISAPDYYAFIDVDTVIAGDIDGDGEETNQDLILLFQYLSGWSVDVVELALDVDDDGEATNQDLILLFQHLSGWNVEIYPQCEHTGGTATCCSKAICEKCHKPYGNLDSNNHVGGTEIRNRKTEDCKNDGYTGDVCCKGCGAVFTVGSTIPALSHTGGTATYYQKAVCEMCQEEYGDYAQMYAYDSLTDNQKRIYNILDDNIYEMNTNFELTDYLKANETVSNLGTNKYKLNSFWETDWEPSQFDVDLYCYAYLYETYLAFKALNYDKPEYFWSPSNIRVKCSIMSKGGKLTYKIFALMSYSITEAQKEQMSQLLEAKADEVVALTENLSSNFEKEIVIHDYLCETITYDHDTADLKEVDESEPYKVPIILEDGSEGYGYYNPWSFTAYGALVNGCAVCEGYSRAMQLICQKIGIPCGLVTGTAIEKYDDYTEETPHMWNIINPGDGCYYLDITFDDPTDYEGPGLHMYFNRTDSYMVTNHILDDGFSEDIFNSATVDFNYFDTHGDNTALQYYTATGTYIGESGVTSAVEFINNHSDMVYFDFMFDTKLYTHLTVRNALMAALNMQKLDYIECTDNIIAIILN